MQAFVQAYHARCSLTVERKEGFYGLFNLSTCEATMLPSSGIQDRVRAISSRISSPLLPSNFSYLKVENFQIRNQESFKVVPIHIYRIFPELVSLHIRLTGIQYIGREHLYGLNMLRYLDLSENRIETIGHDLFEFQPNQMEKLSFAFNPIEYIGFNVFSKMSKLKTLHFASEYYGTRKAFSCYMYSAIDDSTEVAKVISGAITSCLPLTDVISRDLQYQRLESEIERALALFASQETKFKTLETNYNQMKTSCEAMHGRTS